MKIEEINNYHEFINLRERWENVLLRSHHSVFSTCEWLSIWWKHFGKDKKLVLLLAEDDNKIVGIAPLMYSVEKMLGLSLGKIEFIGTGHSDYNDFIIAEKKEECINLFINHLNYMPEKWHCIDLNEIPENTETVTLLRKMSKYSKRVNPCPYVTLPKSYEEFMQGPDGRARFKDITRHLKSLQKSFTVDLVDCSGLQSYEEGMQWLFNLHQNRWKTRGTSGAFADSKFRSFHLAVAKSFAERGWLGLFLLKLSEDPVAASYGFKYNSKYYLYLTGFNPKYAKYGVGNILIAKIIHECIENGFGEFDLMRGDEAYKARWASGTRWNRHLIIIAPGAVAGVQYWLLRKYLNRGKELKSLLKTTDS